MKTVRFSALVEAAGRPDTYLLLLPPEKDKGLQAAIKARRVMTLHQEPVGSKKDYGTVGFEPGRARQFLIFPKSISSFQGSRIVGVKYDLLANDEERSDEERREPTMARETGRARKKTTKTGESPHKKVVHFSQPDPQEQLDEEDDTIEDIKNQVRHAMEALEQGKQVAAFNLLKRIVDR